MLPHLEELSIEGCGLGDLVPTFYADQPLGARTNEALFPLLAKLFPSLVTLDLTYNLITSKSLTADALSALILDKNKPLKHLRLRGNRIADLNGFQGLAEHFKGHREMPGWKLEELDLRDNEIGRLPAELGLLPLDVFLVDGNT
jgi:Leucine-rich repeat (LRR) protein